MAIGVQVWSTTASNNSTADTNINWAEGMAPSQVNDSARAEMASVAKWRDDNSGSLNTTGTTAAYTVTTNQVEAALTDGYTVTVKFHATNDSSATLAVDSLAAKNLQAIGGTNVSSGTFTAGAIVRFKYDSGSTAWIANGANLIDGAGSIGFDKLPTPPASVLLGNPTTSTSTLYQPITLGTYIGFSGTAVNALINTPAISVFTSSGAATWQSTTKNGNFPLYLKVRMVGGGAGGGAATANAGSSGIDTAFSNWTAIGGSGGASAQTNGAGGAGGAGGTDGTGTKITRVAGQAGGGGGGQVFGGFGGNSFFGGAGSGPGANGQAGTNAATNSGSGGSGGSGTGNIAAGGGAGEFAEFIITTPSTSYTGTVGAGGAGGTAGTHAGGNGGTGRIEVISYWQ